MDVKFPRLEEVESQLEAIFAEAGDNFDMAAVKTVGGTIEEKAAAIKALNDEREQLLGVKDAAVGAGHREGGFGGRGDDPAAAAGLSAVPSLAPDRKTLDQLHQAVLDRRSLRVQTKATVTSANTGADQLAVAPSPLPRRSRRIAAAARLSTQSVEGITSAEFPVFGAGAAGITGEGVAKTEYDNITPGSATPQMISIWTDVTRQTVITMGGFQQKLSTVLEAKVAQREDLLLLSTVTGTTGIQTLVGALSADLVLEGAAMVAAGDVAAEPSLVAVNPSDVPTLLGTTVGAGGTASPPFAEFLPTLHGLMVYPTNHVTAGQAVIGAWAAASRFVVGLTPTFFTDAVSGLKTNTITILLEEAVALAVDRKSVV